MIVEPEIPGDDEPLEWEAAEEGDLSDILGFDFASEEDIDRSGLRALINSAFVSHRRMPMLDVVFDRTARRMSTSLRQMTDENVEVTLDDVASTRFGDFFQSRADHMVHGVARSDALDVHFLFTVEGGLVSRVVDLLLGGRRGRAPLAIEGRSFTAIELSLAQRMVELMIADFDAAFAAVAKGDFRLERLEPNARFAAIAPDACVCVLAKFLVNFDGAQSRVSLLMPYAALEPVRERLLQDMVLEGESDAGWRRHLHLGVDETKVTLEALLCEQTLTIGEIRKLKKGATLTLKASDMQAATLRAGSANVGIARIGKSGSQLAVRLAAPIQRPDDLAPQENTP